jgi:hypothetical protein
VVSLHPFPTHTHTIHNSGNSADREIRINPRDLRDTQGKHYCGKDSDDRKKMKSCLLGVTILL